MHPTCHASASAGLHKSARHPAGSSGPHPFPKWCCAKLPPMVPTAPSPLSSPLFQHAVPTVSQCSVSLICTSHSCRCRGPIPDMHASHTLGHRAGLMLRGSGKAAVPGPMLPYSGCCSLVSINCIRRPLKLLTVLMLTCRATHMRRPGCRPIASPNARLQARCCAQNWGSHGAPR